MKKIKTSIICFIITIIHLYPLYASDQCVEYPTIDIDSVKLQNKKIDSIILTYYSHRQKKDSIWITSRTFLKGYEEWGFRDIEIKYISDTLFKCKETRSVEINNVPYFNIQENQKKLLSIPNLQYLSICDNWNINFDTSIVDYNAPYATGQ